MIFKGGTSLEKLRLIQRFSEDLDLLVVGAYPSDRAAKRALKDMCQTAASAVGCTESEPRSGGSTGAFHRRAWIEPPLGQPVAPGLADPRSVLVELGQSGGNYPTVSTRVTSLLGRQLAQSSSFGTAQWADLADFTVEVLHPGRTLIEKLLRINNFVHTVSSPDGVHGWARIGRQFYDVWATLGDDAVQELLADKKQVLEILDDCYRVSAAFVEDHRPPAGGFAACLAFDDRWEHSSRLRDEHDEAMAGLYYGTEPGPSFDEVLQRVHAHAALLDPSPGAAR